MNLSKLSRFLRIFFFWLFFKIIFLKISLFLIFLIFLYFSFELLLMRNLELGLLIWEWVFFTLTLITFLGWMEDSSSSSSSIREFCSAAFGEEKSWDSLSLASSLILIFYFGMNFPVLFFSLYFFFEKSLLPTSLSFSLELRAFFLPSFCSFLISLISLLISFFRFFFIDCRRSWSIFRFGEVMGLVKFRLWVFPMCWL